MKKNLVKFNQYDAETSENIYGWSIMTETETKRLTNAIKKYFSEYDEDLELDSKSERLINLGSNANEALSNFEIKPISETIENAIIEVFGLDSETFDIEPKYILNQLTD